MRAWHGVFCGLLVASGVAMATAARAQPPPNSQTAHDESRWFRNVRQLTSVDMGMDRSGEAYFSPDGKRISFQAWPRGKQEYQIYVMNLDGTGLKMVSTGEGATTCSYFPPTAATLLSASHQLHLRRRENPAEVDPMRPRPAGDGDTAAGQHPGGSPGSTPASRPAGHPGAESQPAGPPHGASHPAGGSSAPNAWVYYPGMDIFEYTFATGALRRLTSSDGYDAECAYSPDGKLIVFSSLRTGSQEIFICDADGQNARQITHAGGKNGGPFFSPDGKRICYRSDRAGNDNLQIFLNNLTGTDERALTGNDTFNWCPFWHPSGKWLIFTQANFRGRPNFDLYVIRDDGSEQHRVTFDPAFDGLPVFSPDGRYLMWTSRRGGLESPQVFIAEFIGLTPAGELRAADR